MRSSLLRFADSHVVPWKNGLGETREVARSPESGEFTWRVSMATVSHHAQFSSFPGVSRRLAVLDGSLELVVGGVLHVLHQGSEAVTFRGDEPAWARPLDRTVTDLNLMTRGVPGSIQALAAGRTMPCADTVLVVSTSEEMVTSDGVLGRFDVLVVGEEGVEIAHGAAGYVVRVAST